MTSRLLTDKKLLILACLAPTIVTFVIVFLPGIFSGHDFNAHALRLLTLQSELDNGQFPPLFDYWSQQQIGYSWQIFYPPLTNAYFLLPIHFFHDASPIFQLKITFIQILLVNFLCAFYVGKRQYNSTVSGLFCAALLTSSCYYLSVLYARFALSELAVFGFVLLFVRGMISLHTDDKDKYLIPISAALILVSSIPITIATATFALIYIALNPAIAGNRSQLVYLANSCIAVLLMAAFYLVPLFYNLTGEYIFMSSNGVFSYREFSELGADALNLLTGLDLSQPILPLSLGVVLNILVIKLAADHWESHKKEALLIVILVILSSSFFPWSLIPDSLRFFNVMQFPWRLLTIATCVAVLWCARAPLSLSYRLCTLLILAALASNPLSMGKALLKRDANIKTDVVYKDYANNNFVASHENYSTFLPIEFAAPPYRNITSNKYTIGETSYPDGFPVFHIRVNQPTTVSLPVLYYRYLRANVNNKTVPVIYNSDGSAGVELTAGNHQVAISYNRNIFHISLLLSAAGLVYLGLLIARGLRASKTRPCDKQQPESDFTYNQA